MGDDGTYLQPTVWTCRRERLDDDFVRNGGRREVSLDGRFIALAGRDTSVSGRVACVGYMDSKRLRRHGRAPGRVILVSRVPAREPSSVLPRVVRRSSAGEARFGTVARLIVADDTGRRPIHDWSQMFSAGIGRPDVLKGNHRARDDPVLSRSFVAGSCGGILRSAGSSLEEARRRASRIPFPR